MVKQIRRFTLRDESAVLDYLSRLSPPKEKLAAAGWTNPDFPSFARSPYGMELAPPPPPASRPLAPPALPMQ